ncbi:MAG: DUF455 family protein [Chloroflexi bacterium]|nr:DUF455 family protein [Chloroflexota bacterium]
MAMQIIAPNETIDFKENQRLLNRYRFIEHALVRALAGWLPATPAMEIKLTLGRLLWEDAQHVQQLYLRLREVQRPAFRAPEDDALEHLMAELLHAPDAASFLAGVFHVVKPSLVAAYERHLAETFANPDAPTRYYLSHTLLDEREQQRWAAQQLSATADGSWLEYVRALLAAAGGADGHGARGPAPAAPACRRTFTAPREAARDGRFSTDMSRIQRPAADDRAGQRFDEFRNYAQEVLAAETCALVLFLTPDMPWEFTYDLARHCYDETRHCWLGIEWLARHGYDYTTFPQNVRVYAWRSQYDPVMQYALLTMGNESHVFEFRRGRKREYQALGDRLSEQFVSYDMADERQHVAFGHKWLPELLRHAGDARPVEAFVDDAVALWQREYVSGAMPVHSA